MLRLPGDIPGGNLKESWSSEDRIGDCKRRLATIQKCDPSGSVVWGHNGGIAHERTRQRCLGDGENLQQFGRGLTTNSANASQLIVELLMSVLRPLVIDWEITGNDKTFLSVPRNDGHFPSFR